MTLYHAEGSPSSELTDEHLRGAFELTLEQIGPVQRVLAIPPDFTRFNSRAGQLTCFAHQLLGERLTDVMPALGTHVPMPDWTDAYRKHAGKWVAFKKDQQTVAGSGDSLKEARNEAISNGCTDPFMMRMPKVLRNFIGPARG